MPNDNADAIVAVYDKHFGRIFGYCARRLFSKDLAEDAAGAVFVRLVQEYDVLKPKGELHIRNWLYGVASNVCAAYLRDGRRRKEIAAELMRQRQAPPPRRADGEGRLDWPVLYRAIGALKQMHQDLLVLRFFEGLETPQIAEALGLPPGTVRAELTRAIRKLREELGMPFGESD